MGDLAEEDIALVVAKRVVDLLETVEIDQHDDHGFIVLALGEGGTELVVEQRPVR